MGNLIEGVLKNDQKVVVVEDLISTGGSALKAVEAIRQAGGQVEHCLSIFHYGFTQAEEAFADKKCRLHSLLTFQSLLEYAEQSGALSKNQTDLLRPWYGDPFGWGEKHGFPHIQPS
jgi:orotate phosphoribosyltransferase